MVCTSIQIETLFVGLFYNEKSGSEYQNIAFWVLLVSYIVMLVLYYLRLRVEILIWMIENEWKGSLSVCVMTTLFGMVNVRQFKEQYMAGQPKKRVTEIIKLKQEMFDESIESSNNQTVELGLTDNSAYKMTVVTPRVEIPPDENKPVIVKQALKLLPVEPKEESK